MMLLLETELDADFAAFDNFGTAFGAGFAATLAAGLALSFGLFFGLALLIFPSSKWWAVLESAEDNMQSRLRH
jgi:hypothetical protein